MEAQKNTHSKPDMKRVLLYQVAIIALLAGSIPSFSQSLNPFVIGTIPAGDSIVIYYDVTINNACGCSQISNQGNVSGSNFPSLVTDDPKTTTANDATITLLNLFPLPITLLEFRANLRNGIVKLDWKASEINVERYEVQRSVSGSSFSNLLSVAAHGNGTHSYAALDSLPVSGNNFYRLKTIDRNGKTAYSGIVKVTGSGKGASVAVHPNPVAGGAFTLQLNNLPKDDYLLEVFNSMGQVIYRKQITHQGGSTLFTVQTSSKQTGMMLVRLRNTNNDHINRILFY